MTSNFSKLSGIMAGALGVLSKAGEAQADGKITIDEAVEIVAAGVAAIAPAIIGHPLVLKVKGKAPQKLEDATQLAEHLAQAIREAAADGMITVEELAGIVGLMLRDLLPTAGIELG